LCSNGFFAIVIGVQVLVTKQKSNVLISEFPDLIFQKKITKITCKRVLLRNKDLKLFVKSVILLKNCGNKKKYGYNNEKL